MSSINLTINNKPVSVPKGSTILDAAKKLNIKIPTLCHLHMDEINVVNQCASCRVCMVTAGRGLVPACGTLAKEGMNVQNNTKEAINARKRVVELLLSDHPQDCLVCEKNGNCELQAIAADLGVRKIRFKGEQSTALLDTSTKSIVKNHDKCILCRRCETMCNDIQTVGVLSGVNRGFETEVGTFFNSKLCDTECTFCGQCISVCPTAALTEVNNIQNVWDYLNQTENKNNNLYNKLMKYTFLQDNEQVELRFFPQEASEVILLLLCNLKEDNVSKNYYEELIQARKIYKEMKMKESDI